MARNMHRYEDLTPYEFDCEKERASIIYVAAGPLEYHEECGALGFDPNKGYAWCLDAAERTGGIVFPMLPIAPAGVRPFRSREEMRERYTLPHHRDEYSNSLGLYPGVFFSRETCRMLYMELLECLAVEMQFRLCVFVGSHAPAGWMIKDIVNEETKGDHSGYRGGYEHIAGDFHGMRVMAVGSMDYNQDVIRAYYAGHGIKRINHGGLWEAALNYAVDPEYFHPEYLDETKYPQHYGALREVHEEGCTRPVKAEFAAFTPEFARMLHETTVSRLAEDVLRNYREVTQGA